MTSYETVDVQVDIHHEHQTTWSRKFEVAVAVV